MDRPGDVPEDLIVGLRFLYVGVDDVEQALARYTGGLGGRRHWRFRHFGADVAAVDLGPGPLLLLADHRPTGSVLPIWSVRDLGDAHRVLVSDGWTVTGPLGTPEGDALVARAPDGDEAAFLHVVRPGALDAAWEDQANQHRVEG